MIKRHGFVISAVAYLFIGLAPGVFASQAIPSYDIQADISSDKRIVIREKIVFDFADATDVYGLLRDLPLGMSVGGSLGIDLIGATNDQGAALPATAQIDQGVFRISIGDQNGSVRGVQTYNIAYRVQNALQSFEGGDQLVWNVTGSGWGVPIERSSAVVVFPVAIPATLIKAECFTGANGSMEMACTQEIETGANTTAIRFATTRAMNVGEGWTILIRLAQPLDSFVSAPSSSRFGWWLVLLSGFLIALVWRPLRTLFTKRRLRAHRQG